MKFNLNPLVIISFIIGFLIPFKSILYLIIIWILIGIGNSVYKKYFKKQ